MTKTQGDLATAVLQQIGVLGADEVADADDIALVQRIYGTKFEEWTARGYADWPKTTLVATEIPDEVFQIVVNLMANEVLPAFGRRVVEEERVAREQYLLVSLRRLVSGTAENVSALRTKTQLSTAVLRKLGIIDPLANPSTKDAQIVWSAYDDKLDELDTKGLVFWTNTDATTAEIPKAVFPILVGIMANEIKSWFGLEQLDSDRVWLEAQLIRELRQHVPGVEESPCGDMTKTQLSTAVLRRLKMIQANETPSTKDAAYVWAAYDAKYSVLWSRDMVYWPNTSATAQEIPKEVFFDLVRIVADDMAPDFGTQLPAEMDENGQMVSPGQMGLRNLRRHVGRASSNVPTKSVFM